MGSRVESLYRGNVGVRPIGPPSVSLSGLANRGERTLGRDLDARRIGADAGSGRGRHESGGDPLCPHLGSEHRLVDFDSDRGRTGDMEFPGADWGPRIESLRALPMPEAFPARRFPALAANVVDNSPSDRQTTEFAGNRIWR